MSEQDNTNDDGIEILGFGAFYDFAQVNTGINGDPNHPPVEFVISGAQDFDALETH